MFVKVPAVVCFSLILILIVRRTVCSIDPSGGDPGTVWTTFQDFIATYSKTYISEQDKVYRFQVFQESLSRQKKLNEYESAHNGTAVYGVNKFSDLTQEEFLSQYLSEGTSNPKDACGLSLSKEHESSTISLEDLPPTFDWREKGVIGDIRNQKRCGSCWAFAVVETIESAYAIENGNKLSHTLSSQQLISCDYNPAKNLFGCNGGYLCEAFLTIVENNMTLVDESVYPFTSENGENQACKAGLPQRGLRLVQHYYYQRLSESTMMTKLVSYSPLAISVNAIAWQDYVGGIIQHHCSSLSRDHAVQIVGYNIAGDVPYWILRNTWGTDWGEKGYLRIKYGENLCGIQSEVVAVSKVTGVNI